jgi:hypothetical protein
MRTLAILALTAACGVGTWKSVRADKPVTRTELQSSPVSVRDPVLRGALAQAGFVAVERPPYKGELELTAVGDAGERVASLRSDGYFVDQVRGDPEAIARALAESSRVAEFVRNSGTVEQRNLPGM